jgi:hypothetical protein
MRRVEEGFGVSIPAVVMLVYSAHLTVAGEVRFLIETHLERLPNILTSRNSARFRASLQIAASRKLSPFAAWPNGRILILYRLTLKKSRIFDCGEPRRRLTPNGLACVHFVGMGQHSSRSRPRPRPASFLTSLIRDDTLSSHV